MFRGNNFRPIQRRRPIIFAFLLLSILIALTPFTNATGTEKCPPGFPDNPAIADHLSQEAIVRGDLSFNEIMAAGEQLFKAQFNICDGQGRPAATGTGETREPDEPAFDRISGPDANSCAGCHNMPRPGGTGDIVANVFVGAQAFDPVLTTTDPRFSAFRNTTGMFGSGAIEMLSREISSDLIAVRDQALQQAIDLNMRISKPLVSKGVSFGIIHANPDGTLDLTDIEGTDPDLIIKPFHQSGRVISLREFTNNAMNHHFGIQTEERFDLNPDKGVDFDQDGISNELSIGDVTAITIWQAGLGVPGQVLPDDEQGQRIIQTGEILFAEIGCTACHKSELQLNERMFKEPNPYNLIGNFQDMNASFEFDMTTQGEGPFLERYGNGAIVRAYTDLKRHYLCDDEINHFCNELISQGRFDQNGKPGAHFFLTARLWTAGDSGPYGHVGDLTTITEAILVHGGEGRAAREAFLNLNEPSQHAVIQFLKSLQVLPKGAKRVLTESELAEYQMIVKDLPTLKTSQQTELLSPSSTSAPVITALILGALLIGIMVGRINLSRKFGS